MRRSFIADSIIQEYKREQAYKKRVRQNCKEVDCNKCKWNLICEDREIEKGEYKC